MCILDTTPDTEPASRYDPDDAAETDVAQSVKCLTAAGSSTGGAVLAHASGCAGDHRVGLGFVCGSSPNSVLILVAHCYSGGTRCALLSCAMLCDTCLSAHHCVRPFQHLL